MVKMRTGLSTKVAVWTTKKMTFQGSGKCIQGGLAHAKTEENGEGILLG